MLKVERRKRMSSVLMRNPLILTFSHQGRRNHSRHPDKTPSTREKELQPVSGQVLPLPTMGVYGLKRWVTHCPKTWVTALVLV